jgi:hypothetical protein
MDIDCANGLVAQTITDMLTAAGLDHHHDYTSTGPTFNDPRVLISLSEAAALQLPVHTIYSLQEHEGVIIRGRSSGPV